jgi:hypothetical protein
MVGFTLSSIKPDKFNETYGSLNKDKGGFTLDAGATRYDSEGHVVAESPYIKTADGGILERDNPGGGDPASTVAAGGSVSPAASSVATALASSGLPAPVVAGFMGNFHAEGGYDGAQGDGGSASGIANGEASARPISSGSSASLSPRPLPKIRPSSSRGKCRTRQRRE